VAIGVSTSCLFPMETERALARLGALGIDTAEVFLSAPSEAQPAFVRRLCAVADAQGIRVTALHSYCSDAEGYMFFGQYPRRLRDGIEEYRRIFEACAALGAQYLVFHGAKTLPPVTRELYFDRYRLLHEEAQRFGVTILQENVARCMSRDPAFLRAMAAALPQARFVLDTKQAIRAGAELDELLEIMGARLARVHISDYRADSDCVPPGAGEMDYGAFFRRLAALGFAGDVIVELYRWGFDDEQELAQSVSHLRRCFEAAQKG